MARQPADSRLDKVKRDRKAVTVDADELISFLLPCHDAAPYLEEALDSLLAQTCSRFEVVAIDDGSTDGTREILEAYARRDKRVRLLQNQRTLGLINTLNRGVAAARGSYMARMDADDVAAPDRVARQIAFLGRRPEVGVVGTAALLINEDGRFIGHRQVRCVGPAGARFLTLFATPVLHSSAFARTEVMRAYPYREAAECVHAEDYDLFVRMVDGGVGLANLDAPLMRVRIRPESVSQTFEHLQVENFVGLARRHLERTVGSRASIAVLRVLLNRMQPTTSPGELKAGLKELTRVRHVFLAEVATDPHERDEVDAITHEQRLDIVLQAFRRGRLGLRLAAMRFALRHVRSLFSRPAQRYLRTKMSRFAATLAAGATGLAA